MNQPEIQMNADLPRISENTHILPLEPGRCYIAIFDIGQISKSEAAKFQQFLKSRGVDVFVHMAGESPRIKTAWQFVKWLLRK